MSNKELYTKAIDLINSDKYMYICSALFSLQDLHPESKAFKEKFKEFFSLKSKYKETDSEKNSWFDSEFEWRDKEKRIEVLKECILLCD